MGHRLCTATRFDVSALTVQRIYRSMLEAYLVAAARPKRDTAWSRQIPPQSPAC
jgi:hypothetical protein